MREIKSQFFKSGSVFHANPPYKVERLSVLAEPEPPLDYASKLEQLGLEPFEVQKMVLTSPVPKLAGSVQLVIRKSSQGLGGILFPKYELYLLNNTKLLLSGKKVTSLTGKYVFSVEHENVCQKSNGYLGKLRSNLFGSYYNLYDHTDSLGFFNSRKSMGNNLLCIVYDFGLLKKKRPRKFTVLVPKPEVYGRINATNVPTTKKDGLYAQYENGHKTGISLFTNKDPAWSDKMHAYVLDFKGRVTKPSVKNFILSTEDGKKDYVSFGKIDENVYALDVSWPFSLYQAFALAISSIAFKVGCE